MTKEEKEQFVRVLNTDEYNDFASGGKYHHILDLLFEQRISPGKAAEAIAEIYLGISPRLPEEEKKESKCPTCKHSRNTSFGLRCHWSLNHLPACQTDEWLQYEPKENNEN